MSQIAHNKVRNSGLLFELLVRQITADVLEGKTESPAINILKTHFNYNTELGKELALYRTFFEVGKLSEAKAFKFTDVVAEQYKKLNTKTLNKAKYALIKEIKAHYPLEALLASNISSYKLHASIYKTFIYESTKLTTAYSVDDIENVTSARYTIVEHLIGSTKGDSEKETRLAELFRTQDEEIRLLAYKLMMETFNKKYVTLSEDQKGLLREYIYSSTGTLRDYVVKTVTSIKEQINSRIEKIDDKVAKIKLQEVISQLDSISRARRIKDNHITAMMMAYEIIKELDGIIIK